MRVTLIKLLKTAIMTLVIAAAPTLATAQNLFRPVAKVNDSAITQYELDQRMLLLEVLRTTGDLKKEAMDRLIDERLQIQAAKGAGISVSAEDIKAGVDEFAQRTDLTGDQFLTSIAAEGVAAESFNQFVAAGLSWRQLVRQRFGPLGNIADFEIDRAISLEGTQGSVRALISEIYLPINTPENEAITRELAPQIKNIRTFAEFADAARRFSAGPSGERGGRVESWLPLENLPPPIRSALLKMKPGEVTEPLEIPNALALFQLRALEETVAPARKNPTVDYAAYYIAGGRSEAALARAAKVRGLADRCDDLYGIAQSEAPEVLERDALPLSEIPLDVAIELAKLDEGEVSTALTRANGQTLVFLMMCGRSTTGAEEPSRDAVRQRLQNQRLTSYANNYLDELRAEAVITRR